MPVPPDNNPGRLRVLVTGSRTWKDEQLLCGVLDAVWYALPHGEMTLVHGCALGADTQADRWGRNVIAHGIGSLRIERHPANWKDHGRRAGLLRNQRMVESGIDLCLAFIRDNSRGASHCARIAEEAGIETRIFTEARHG